MVVPNDAALINRIKYRITIRNALVGLGSSVVTLTGQASTGSTWALYLLQMLWD